MVVEGFGASPLFHSCDRVFSAREAMRLTFLNSLPFIPKKVAIWTICAWLTKSFGSEQNLSSDGSYSRQLIALGNFSPR